MSEKFMVVGWWVVGWIIESLCLPTEVFRDLSVTLMLQVKVKVTVKVTVKETGVSRETGCDNFFPYTIHNATLRMRLLMQLTDTYNRWQV